MNKNGVVTPSSGDQPTLDCGDTLEIMAATRSSARSQINILPPELLLEIFSISKSCCMRDSKSYFQNFASVCGYWRQLAFGEPRLWTHVDIGPGMPLWLSKLILARSECSPIHIHMHISRVPHPNFTTEREKDSIFELMTPHIRRVRTLGILVCPAAEALVASTLSLWLDRGDPSVAKSLWIRRPHATSTIFYRPTKQEDESAARQGNSEAMINALTQLKLQRIILNWDVHTYRGLFDLHLSFKKPHFSASISDRLLARILSANPCLVNLKISNLTVNRTDSTEPVEPVLLNHLQNLGIFEMTRATLDCLLPIIRVPESSEISVGITPRYPIECTIKEFLLSARVTSLYWYNCAQLPFSSYHVEFLKSLPHLRTLVLDKHLIPSSLSRDPNVVLSPLVLVTLLKCRISLEGLKNFVSICGTQELHIEKCREVLDGDDIEKLGGFHKELYPTLKVHVTNTSSVMRLSYCSSHI
ncbi:F-box-like protein [Ceratobasidium sp. AG-Ba]|nr:F-box-like protein [Ceratobasidium sp. AG-Ba]